MSGKLIRHHLKHIMICGSNGNEANLDILAIPLFGEPGFAPLAIDASQFKTKSDNIEEHAVLMGSQPDQHYNDSNSDSETALTDDFDNQNNMCTEADLTAIAHPSYVFMLRKADHCIHSHPIRNRHSEKFLRSFQHDDDD